MASETPLTSGPATSSAPALPEGHESSFHSWLRQRHRGSLAGNCPGDDLAVLSPVPGLLLLGVDPVLDGVHIDLGRHGFGPAGRKAMNRNLSDVAAMGGRPVAATLSLVVPRSMRLNDVQDVYTGAEKAGREAGCPIVGGDLASWDGRLVVTVGILGQVDRPVLRERARPGQTIFVTGPLGGSILGRHLSFKPRLEMGLRAAGEFGATSMIDISDGLSRDLPRMLGPGVGCTIDADALPIHRDATRLAAQSGRQPVWHALHDGEDYELLFTADADKLPGCIAIGRIDDRPWGVRLQLGGSVVQLGSEGWEHRLGLPAPESWA